MIHKRGGRGELQQINKEGVTVLLVEQNAAMALAICHRDYVLEIDKIILEGKAAELSRNDRVRQVLSGFGLTSARLSRIESLW